MPHEPHALPPPALLPSQTAAAIFGGLGEQELLGVKAVMRKLSRGVVHRRGRSSSTKGSVVGAAAGLKAKPKKGAGLGVGRGAAPVEGRGRLCFIALH